MPTVSHAILCMHHHEKTSQNRTTLKRRHNFGDIFAYNEVNIKDVGHGEVFHKEVNVKDIGNGAVFHKQVNVKDIGHGEVFRKENDTELVMIKRVCKEILLNNNVNKKKNNDEIKIEHNILLLNDKDETIRSSRHNNPISTNNNTTVGKDENLSKTNLKRHGNEGINRIDNLRKRNKENLIKKPRWKLNTEMLVILVILNVISQGIAVEVISTNTLASLLGYPSTCTQGADIRPCTLSLTCWLRGGTRLRGCGGWLFSCCQPPDNTWDSFDNTIPSSDWKYTVSPPRLRQVPQRNVMPNNVFRRRVDDDVTPQFDCGLPSSRILQKRIIGGREARFAEFPWQAHVRISEFQCGGVLVSRWYVATAAHCVSRAHIRDISVWLGALDTSAGSHTARKVGIIKKILHPLFRFRMTQPDRYDIALLKLSRPITFSRHIRAICLPESEMELRGRAAVIAGWGKTDATDTHTGTNMLRSATVPILSKEQCITWHRSKQISVEIHSEMICAGHSDGHQDACLGDSGGPLIVLDSGRYYLVGITSAGFGCGVDHQPGIYHNVQVTANWIRGVMAPSINYIED